MDITLYVVTICSDNRCEVLGIFADKSKAITLQHARNEQLKEACKTCPDLNIQVHVVDTNGYLSINSR